MHGIERCAILKKEKEDREEGDDFFMTAFGEQGIVEDIVYYGS